MFDVTLIIIVLFIIIGLVVWFINYILREIRSRQLEGKMIFLYDSKKKRIRLTNTKLNQDINKYIWPREYILKSKDSIWISLDMFLNSFAESGTDATIRNLLYKAAKSNNNFSQVVSTNKQKWTKGKTILFTIKANRLSDGRHVNLFLGWQQELVKVDNSLLIEESRIDELIKWKYPYASVIGFRLNDVKNGRAKFISVLNNITDLKKVHYIYKRNILVIIFGGHSDSSVKKRVNKFKSLIKVKGNELGINHLVSSSAIFNFRSLNTTARFMKAVAILEYLIYLAGKTRVSFMSQESKHYNKEEAYRFLELGSRFRDAARLNKVEVAPQIIKQKGHANTSIYWAKPYIESVPSNFHNIFLQNKWYRNLIVDAMSTRFTKERTKQTLLIDINEDWFVANASKFKNHKAIYILNLDRNQMHDEVISLVNKMTGKGYHFGLRVKMYNEETANFISSTKLKVIIIDESISRNPYDPNTYIDIISLNKISKVQNIRLIFENPIDYYNSMREKEMGFQYYYTYEY